MCPQLTNTQSRGLARQILQRLSTRLRSSEGGAIGSTTAAMNAQSWLFRRCNADASILGRQFQTAILQWWPCTRSALPCQKNTERTSSCINFRKKINNLTCNHKEQQNWWKLTSAGGRFSCWRPTPNDSNRFWFVEKMSCRRNGLTEPLELYLGNVGKNVESMFQPWKVMFEWYEYILIHLLY